MIAEARLTLWLADGGAEDEFNELCEILRNSGAAEVRRPVLPDPKPGFRGSENMIADVVAKVEPTVGVVGRILAALRGWLAAKPQRSIELSIGDTTIKINGFSSMTEDRLVDAFLQSVSKGNDR